MPSKPSLGLLRSLTDEHVLRALIDARRLTRAELAARTGISKPTVSESVRRLSEAGLLRDTGERTTGRGRAGTYYALHAAVGCALAVGVDADGVVAEALDVHGDVLSRSAERLARPARPADVATALATAAGRAAAAGPIRLAVVSAADPVDRASGRLVHLPDAPFLLGELSPVAALDGVLDGPVHVDNDVNWAARAERDAAPGLDDFVYVHLGEGLGCAVVGDGSVQRGNAGLAGEIAHLVTVGPGGRAVRFIDVFGELALRRDGSTAVDVDALLRAAGQGAARDGGTLATVADAVCGVLTAAVALADPSLVVLGGSWGRAPAVVDAVGARFRRSPRPVPVRAASVTTEPALAGARVHAVHELRASVVGSVAAANSAG